MIDKTIHYCWFGKKPLPPLAKKCIASWEKFCPEFKIVQWNEENFDVNISIYTKHAYEAKKYAFVSDYARFWILYNFGGVYLDTDVQLLKSLSPILENGAFMGCESDLDCDPDIQVATGLGIAASKGHNIYKEILDLYDSLSFLNEDGSLNMTTVVEHVTSILKSHGLKCSQEIQIISGINIYPPEYFNPRNKKRGKYQLSPNTYSIHHYAGSWMPPSKRRKQALAIKIEKILGTSLYIKLMSIKHKLLGENK